MQSGLDAVDVFAALEHANLRHSRLIFKPVESVVSHV
jgi:hypothetical protein